ncbi:hypothetical protein OEZ85_013837 [Tetradesmus obliquus]|uniref:SET domain-containing protein n=1 Tax=Tetradesmus obliquus TaxID=3088 RepID=A0ABY8U6R5_TETOB|nr:hypothetical protein OEZ85_013837 [Tetradesmus obliquus]
MALRLLRERHASRQHNSSSSSSSGTSSSSFWQPWLASLPQHVPTPLEFTAAEVQQLVLPSTIQAVHRLQSSVELCFAEQQQQLAASGCNWQDFLWAVQVLHSRCFLDAASGCHVAVPGIDMANHSSSAANAAVQLHQQHCPGAEEEIGAATDKAAATSGLGSSKSSSGNSSCFQLVAGPEGVSAGEQVCISYGSWPAEPFLLLWGFTPSPNPADAVVVFSSLQDMAACYFDYLKSKLTAGGNGQQLLQCEQLGAAVEAW